MVRGPEIPYAVQMGMLFRDEAPLLALSRQDDELKILAELKPPVAKYTPLIFVETLAQPSRQGIIKASVLKPDTGIVTIAPNLERLAEYFNLDGKLPDGVSPPRGLVVIVPLGFFSWPNIDRLESTILLKRLIEARLCGGRRRHEGRVWLVEEADEKPDPVGERNRKDFLRLHLGLVGASVHQNLDGLVYVTGRPEKVRAKSRRIDVGGRPYINPMMEGVAEELEGSGWQVISWEEAKLRLEATRFAQDDLGRLKLGFGIWVVGTCGECFWRINALGSIEHHAFCDDRDCSLNDRWSRSLLERTFQRKGPVIIRKDRGQRWEPMPSGVFCGECSSEIGIVRLMTLGSGKKAEIFEEKSCPHCGLVGKRTFSCSLKRIRLFEDLEEQS
jgi:hypothetical protein